MIRIEEVVQLRAFARQDGALMALVWIASFLFTVYVPQNGIGSLLAITIPFVLGWRLCAFRNYALDGIISFRRAYLYCVYTFFYASLIFAVAQFVFFKFFDHGTFAMMLNDTIQTITPAYRQAGVSVAELKEAAEMVQNISPVQWAFTFMMQNIFVGFVLSLPVAALCRKTIKQ